MRKQIQRKPIRVSRQEVVHEKEQVSNRAVKIQDIVGIFSSLSGVIAAMLWVAGRYYTAAYFKAMNIPFSRISYSVWEYAEAAGPRLFFLLWAKSFFPLVILTSALLSAFLFAFVLQRIFPRLSFVDALRNLTAQTVSLPRGFRGPLALALILLITYFLTQVATEVSKTGSQAGQQAVLNESYAVDVYSKDVIPLESSPVPAGEHAGYKYYDGLRLLTHNNGKYYLFREIDLATCRPKQVYVLPDTEDIYVVVKEITPILPPCTAVTADQ